MKTCSCGNPKVQIRTRRSVQYVSFILNHTLTHVNASTGSIPRSANKASVVMKSTGKSAQSCDLSWWPQETCVSVCVYVLAFVWGSELALYVHAHARSFARMWGQKGGEQGATPSYSKRSIGSCCCLDSIWLAVRSSSQSSEQVGEGLHSALLLGYRYTQ